MKHPVLAGSLVAIGASTLLFVLAPVGGAQDTLNCSNFRFQEDAQLLLDRDRSDPHNIDADNDGMACDTLPRGGGTGESQGPSQPPSSAAAPTRGTPRQTG